MSYANRRVLLLSLVLSSGLVPNVQAQQKVQAVPVVDEPLGARYSLGLTQWHLGHNAEMIRRLQFQLRLTRP